MVHGRGGGLHSARMAIDVTDFDTDVVAASHQQPVLVDLWAPWCGPCKMLGPILEKLAAQAEGRWILAKVNVETQQECAGRLRVSSIPDVRLYSGGKPLDGFVGGMTEAALRHWLERAIPSPSAAVLASARAALAEGNRAEAARLAQQVLDAGASPEASVLLAEALWLETPSKVGPLLQAILPGHANADRAEMLRALAGLALLTKESASLPPGAMRETFLAGAHALAQADYALALEKFLEVLRQDRHWAEGAAKDACKVIFQWLGMRHPVSERFSRAFSSTLNT